MQKTKIQWSEKVWNPVTGCNKVSSGCKNCYAETIANRFWKDRKFTDVICHHDRLNQPLKLRKPYTIFVNSMSDLFHEKVPFEFMRKVFFQMFKSPKHKFIILTKRPERAKEFLGSCGDIDYLNHIYLGVSISKNEDLHLLETLKQIPIKNKIVSLEPLLENIECDLTGISWVIIGAESGKNKRACKNEWILNLVNQCKEKNIPCFVKQIHNTNGNLIKDIKEFPKHLQIQLIA
jgi:protein gp37